MHSAAFIRYAKPLFELACDSGESEQVFEQLGMVSQLLEKNKEIKAFFAGGSVTKEEKFAALEKSFKGEFSPNVVNFLKLLVSRYKIQFLPQIFKEFKALFNEYKNIEEVTVISAVSLSEEEKQRICSSLEAKLGKKVELLEAIDPRILGGLVLRYGGKVLDASLRGKLKNLRRELAV